MFGNARLANITYPDLKKQSDQGLCCLSRSFWQQLVFKILENLPYFVPTPE